MYFKYQKMQAARARGRKQPTNIVIFQNLSKNIEGDPSLRSG